MSGWGKFLSRSLQSFQAKWGPLVVGGLARSVPPESFGRYGRCSLQLPYEIDHPEFVYVEDDVLVGPYLQARVDPVTGSLRFRRRAYLGRFGTITARFPVEFGEAVMAGDQLCLGVDPPPGKEPGPVVIGQGTFVGVGSIICSGVSIGDGCYVGAGSVVMEDMPAGYLIAGNPARAIRPLHG